MMNLCKAMDEYIDLDASKGFDSENSDDDDSENCDDDDDDDDDNEDEYFDEGRKGAFDILGDFID